MSVSGFCPFFFLQRRVCGADDEAVTIGGALAFLVFGVIYFIESFYI